MDTNLALGQHYHPRLIDKQLREALSAAGAVVIEGARASGKTMTAMHAAQSFTFVDDITTQRLLDIAPHSILEGDNPRLLDEWQIAPQLWNMVRRAVDAAVEPGLFILTGSAVPTDDLTRHTGAGRFLRLRQRTMTWQEKLNASNPQVSISRLVDGEKPRANTSETLTLDDVVENLLQPGFPAMRTLALGQAAQRLRAYIDDVARTDVPRLADVRHGPDVIKRLIAAVARNTASDVTLKTLTADAQIAAPGITAETISHYLDLLQRLFVVEPQEPWTPALRSRARLRRSPKLHLVDPSLAAASLGAGPKLLREDLETLGILFESAVTHDLAVHASTLGGEVRHYRDSNGKEIDAIVTLPDGRWGAIEIKLGGSQVSSGMKSLRHVVNDIDTGIHGEPSFLLVVTGTGPVLTALDGTVTCPLSELCA